MTENKNPDTFNVEELTANRSQQRRQVSYGWVETVREAGELYRDTEKISAVSDKLDLSDKEIHDALTVYRVIFENPPEKAAIKVYPVGRAFFSLNKGVGDAIDKDESEPVKDLLREFVGVVHLECDISEEPVGDPVERTTPPSLTDFNEITKNLKDLSTYSTASIIENSGITDFQDIFRANRAKMIANMMKPVIEQRNRMVSNIAESIFAPQREMMQTLASASIQPIFLHQNILNSLVINSFEDILIPEPVIADLASIQPTINTTAVTPPTPTISKTVVSETPTVEYELSETNPTLPNPDTITSELVSEIPAMVVQAIFSPPDVRAWYSNLPKADRYSIIYSIIILVGSHFIGVSHLAYMALFVPSIDRRIINDEEDE